MKVHFISIGGAIMHQLALSLQRNGHSITGSDDAIYDPSRSRLAAAGLLPDRLGWDASRITEDVDLVILGMHARANNPELMRAKELGLALMSFPEFIYEQTKNKKRVVVGGSHGKTTISSMLAHVLINQNKRFDYLIGATIEALPFSVEIGSNTDLVILEGDEYLSSPIDRRPKFLHYHPQIAILTGIAWDHINVFPTEENYIEQFDHFLSQLEDGAALIYFKDDSILASLAEKHSDRLNLLPYGVPEYRIERTGVVWPSEGIDYQMSIIGDHNLANAEAARLVCSLLSISDADFMKAISSFTGAARRLQSIYEGALSTVYNDFAHAPSKVKASVKAVADFNPERKLLAVLELHTYSSLNPVFIDQYKGALDLADHAVVLFDPAALAIKKLPPMEKLRIEEAFGREVLAVFDDPAQLKEYLQSFDFSTPCDVLLMSSGNFGGLDKNEIVTFVAP